MKLLYLTFPLLYSEYWEKYNHPDYKLMISSISKKLNKESKKNFMMLKFAKYEHRIIKEQLHNKSSMIKVNLLNKKMQNKRKTDIMFSKHASMVYKNHMKSENNLKKLETIRKHTSHHLSHLKHDHIIMKNKLIKNNNVINDIMKNKHDKHLNITLDNYIKWKQKREEILDTINFDNDL